MISSWYLICIILAQLCIHTLNESIEHCSFEKKFNVRSVGEVSLSGFINADLDTESINNVIIIKNTTFQGILEYPNLAAHLNVKFDSLKTARVQRTVDYYYSIESFYPDYPTELVSDPIGIEKRITKCSIGFTYNFETRLALPFDVMNNIFNIAEECIEKKLCDFDPQKKAIGGNVAVMSRVLSGVDHSVYLYTKQDTFNLIMKEQLKKILGAVTEKSTVIPIPPFAFNFTTLIPVYGTVDISISASGGIVNVLKHIDTQGDITFLNEGQRFIIGGTLHVTGGEITINNLNISVSSLGYLYSNTVKVNPLGISLSLQETLDLSEKNCNLNVEMVKPHIPEDAVDFAQFETKITNENLIQLRNGLNDLTSGVSDAFESAVGKVSNFCLWDCPTTTTTTTPPPPPEIKVDIDTFLTYIPYLKRLLFEQVTENIKASILEKLQTYRKCTDFNVL